MAGINLTHSGIAVLRRIGGNPWLQRLGLKTPFERLVFAGSKSGFRAASAGARQFKQMAQLAKAQRPDKPATGGRFDLTPSEEQAMMGDSVARYAAERLRPAAATADAACQAPAGLLAEVAELGVASLFVPQALGGAATEHSAVTGAIIAEALAQGDMGLALAALAPVGVINVLTRYGTAEQQSRYLAAFAENPPPTAALALAEARTLADPLCPATQVIRSGRGWLLSGEKAAVPLALDAELFLVSAVDEQGDAGLFVVEAGSGGLSVRPEPGMGVRAGALGTLRFDKLKLDKEARIGGDGRFDLQPVIDYSRLAWCALAVGTAQAVVDYVIPYVNERQAFGEPVSHRQSVAFAVADMALEVQAMRLLTWRAAARADQDKNFGREAALAHRLCALKGMQIGSQGVQLLGGHGFVKEHPVERWYRDLRAVGIMYGAVCL